jgi:hypothetical protein
MNEPNPCGRMAGFAMPLRASKSDEREAKDLDSIMVRIPSIDR